MERRQKERERMRYGEKRGVEMGNERRVQKKIVTEETERGKYKRMGCMRL